MNKKYEKHAQDGIFQSAVFGQRIKYDLCR